MQKRIRIGIRGMMELCPRSRNVSNSPTRLLLLIVSPFVSTAADSREMKRESRKAQGQPMEMSQKCRQSTAALRVLLLLFKRDKRPSDGRIGRRCESS